MVGVIPLGYAGQTGTTLRQPLMGTLVEIQVLDQPAHIQAQAISMAFTAMSHLADMMSHYKPDSVVSAINLAAGICPVAVPSALMQVLKLARTISETTAGAFDITVGSIQGWRFTEGDVPLPADGEIQRQRRQINFRHLHLDERHQTAYLRHQGMRIDLGGVAKHAILNAGMQTLRGQGIQQAMINGGGDVLAMGGHADRPWRVGIRDPRSPSKLLGVVKLHEGIVASSGDYERCRFRGGRRYHHIIDPRTGYPSTGVHGVTLVADGYVQLDGLGTAIMVMGQARGSRLIEQTAGRLQGLIAGQDQSLWLSDGMRRLLT